MAGILSDIRRDLMMGHALPRGTYLKRGGEMFPVRRLPERFKPKVYKKTYGKSHVIPKKYGTKDEVFRGQALLTRGGHSISDYNLKTDKLKKSARGKSRKIKTKRGKNQVYGSGYFTKGIVGGSGLLASALLPLAVSAIAPTAAQGGIALAKKLFGGRIGQGGPVGFGMGPVRVL